MKESPLRLQTWASVRYLSRVALSKLGERLGSGDGERWTLLTRQIAFEPLPASVLFALVLAEVNLMASKTQS